MNGKERKQEIFAMFAEGRTYAEIGRVFNISRQRVQQIVRPPIQVLHALRRRAGDKCERCRIPLRGGDEHVHHLDKHITGRYDDLKRVRLLCRSCHKVEDLRLEPHKQPTLPHEASTLGPCKVLGCRGKGNGKYFTRGYCKLHYHRLRRSGEFEGRPVGRPRKASNNIAEANGGKP